MSEFKVVSKEELKKMLEGFTFKQLHIHHTWKPDHSNFDGNNHLTLQNNMRNYHVNTRGWSAIGQHVTLMPDGQYVTGRPFGKTPASIKGWNTGAFAIEMLGNFDTGNDPFDKAQKESILYIANYFGEKIGYDNVKFHREGPGVSKSCPGTAIDKAEFIKEATDLNKKAPRRVKELEL